MSVKRKNTRRMNKLRTEFFEQGKQQDTDPTTRHLSWCWLCPKGEAARIDYTVPAGTTPDSHNLDHYTTVEERPDLQEDPEVFRHAHKRCNESRGNRTPSPGLGAEVPDWW